MDQGTFGGARLKDETTDDARVHRDMRRDETNARGDTIRCDTIRVVDFFTCNIEVTVCKNVHETHSGGATYTGNATESGVLM